MYAKVFREYIKVIRLFLLFQIKLISKYFFLIHKHIRTKK